MIPSLLINIIGFALGMIDYAIKLTKILGGKQPKFFSKGWGNPQRPIDEQNAILAQFAAGKIPKSMELHDLDITWENKPTRDKGITMKTGIFLSPLTHLLPEPSKQCRFYLVESSFSSSSSTTATTTMKRNAKDVVVIMLPATGEAGISQRLSMAKKLLDKHPTWSFILVTAPLYSHRQPKDQKLFFVNTVELIMVQGLAIMQEAAALAFYYLTMNSNTKVCITGFSWGAAMSACATSMTLSMSQCGKQQNQKQNFISDRLACVPYVGCGSPDIVAKGVISNSVDFNALKDKHNKNETEEQTRLRAVKVLNQFQFSTLVNQLLTATSNNKHSNNNNNQDSMTLPFVKSMFGYTMRNDAFIPFEDGQQFKADNFHLVSKSKTKVSWKVLPGGHALAALLRPWFQTHAIVHAVCAMKEESEHGEGNISDETKTKITLQQRDTKMKMT